MLRPPQLFHRQRTAHVASHIGRQPRAVDLKRHRGAAPEGGRSSSKTTRGIRLALRACFAGDGAATRRSRSDRDVSATN